jgi:hypothetical protein
LTSLEGLNNLTSIRGALNISGNSILTDLTGLSRLISVGGTVTIIYHDDLVDFSGLNVLRSIGGDLQIVVNPGLTSLDGLEKLDSIGGTLFIYGNSTLTGISGLQSLTTLRGTLAIQYNPLLLSLSGLENIAPASLGGLAVTNNDVLSTCNVTGICNYLAYPGASVTIVQNGEGCNSQTEVEAACKALSSGDLPTQTIDIYPNPCRESFTIRTDVILSENDITIYNNLGQRTGNWRLQNSTVDISQLRQGAYLLILQNKRDPIRAKIIVY